jgi:hypothetical protein
MYKTLTKESSLIFSGQQLVIPFDVEKSLKLCYSNKYIIFDNKEQFHG